MSKVSVIMPSLNVAAYIRESVSSVTAQSLREIEVLCVDAGSTDGTREILDELAEADTRVRVYHSDVKSYGYQVNLGIRLAKGEYIAIVETDDYIDPGMYARLYQAARDHNCDYIKSDYFFYWTQTDGKRFFVKRKMFLDSGLYGRVVEPVRYSQAASGDWYLWNGIYKRSFLLKNRIRFHETPGAAFQDIGFLYQTNIYAKRVLYLEEPFYRYCIDRDGSSSNSGKALEYACREFQELVKEEQGSQDIGSDALRALYIRMSRSFLYSYPELDWEGGRENQETRALSYEWFRERLSWAVKARLISREEIGGEIWDRLCTLLVSERRYFDGIRSQGRNVIRKLGEERQYPVIIFGCGHHGFLAYRWLEKRKYSVVAFMDNNPELWGKTINGIAVRSPENIEALGDDTRYCVANALYHESIKKQILGKGVGEERIAILM